MKKRHGKPHPQLMGAASAVWQKKVVFFGGGSPIDRESISSDVTTFDIAEKKWETLFHISEACRNSSADELFPSPRQGIRGIVLEDEFYVFGGRVSHFQKGHNVHEDEFQGCRNDLWAFNLKKREWRNIETTGERPAPRVWY